MIYNKYDIVKVPFPCTEKNFIKKRPAVIISSKKYQSNFQHVILCMITSAKHSDWVDDIVIQNLSTTGLPVASKIRFKIFSLDEKLIIGKMGTLDNQNIKILSTKIKEYL